jgi:hypothetical protein
MEIIIPKMAESIKIKGLVEIINGDTYIVAENKFVQNMLIRLVNMTTMSRFNDNFGGGTWGMSTYAWDVYIGTDTTTGTVYNTPSLSNPIGTTPGTAANIKTGSTSNPSNGVFRVTFSTTWNPGTVSGTVGEMALYLSVKSTLQSFGWTLLASSIGYGSFQETKQLVSRLAAADGTLTPFIINTINPLTINWTVQFNFA